MSIKKDQILEAFNYRYACKKFNAEKKISDEDFDTIIQAGILSPSSFGLEPFKFIVIQNPEIREEIREVSWGAQGQLPTASHFILFASRKAVDMKAVSEYMLHMLRDVKHLPEELVEMLSASAKRWQEEDFKLTDDKKIFDWASKQSYIPLGNMMTVAAMLGIDSCAIEGFNQDKVNDILKKHDIVDTEHFGSAVMLALGYRSEDAEIFPKTRQSYDELVKFV